MKNLTPLAKIIFIVIIVGAIIGGIKFLGSKGTFDSIIPKERIAMPEGVSKDTPVIRVVLNTWCGFPGGPLFNEGFKANVNSRFYKNYKFLVDFVLIDSFVQSRDAWKSGDVDLLWVTVDEYPTEVQGLAKHEPKFIFQNDWSRGGDAIVVREGINKVNDLKGKKIAVAMGTPSHSFLIWLLKAGGLSMSDIDIKQVENGIDAATAFKARAVDAAVVWSPDDEDCITKIAGSKVLKSTKSASNIIADGFIVKGKYFEKNKKILSQLVEGWLIGNAEINTNQASKKKAALILSQGFNQPLDFCLKGIDNTRLVTIGDNKNFFGLDTNFKGVKGEDLYIDMSVEYAKLGLASASVTPWREVSNSSIINELQVNSPAQYAEGKATFAVPTEAMATAESIATKRITVNFEFGSSNLTDDAKVIIDKQFGSIAKAFGKSRVRIEGNTDIVGSRDANVFLSKKRAETVASFLSNRYGFDRNRFVIVGNGPDKPVANNDDEEGRAQNRRTDFEILN